MGYVLILRFKFPLKSCRAANLKNIQICFAGDSRASHAQRIGGALPDHMQPTYCRKVIRQPAVAHEVHRVVRATRRLKTADELASAAVFLASDQSSFITGIELPVDVVQLPDNPQSAHLGCD
jgi:hypothetical protein